MQLLSAIVRRYRVHLELSVDFDPARTLLGGPNEVGKSTLIEAIHRALFLKARITGAARDSMLRLPHDGAPEVELQFRAAGRTYRLQKRFAGTNGSTWLRDDAGVALQGEEAESRLAEILGVEARNGGPGARNRAFQQWAHLWVWQGKAGDDPAEPIAAEQSRLLQRLQAMGGAAALQSDRDARVARHFAKARDSIFTQQGQPKAGSELHRAEQALAGAESERTCAAERVQRLEQTAADLESASRDLAAAAQSLQRLRQEQQQVDARLQQLARLRVQETEQRQAAATAAQHHAALETANRQILTTRTELGAVEQALAPKSEQLRQLEQARDQDRRRLAEADARSRGCNDAARLARLRHELASAQSTLFEKTALHARLTDKARTIAERRDAIAALEGELANLPAITRTKLERIQRLETNCSTAAAALQAMAAEIEVLASDQPALIGDDAVPVGQSRILTADTEVRLGEAIRLRIRPGGGTSLAAARAARDDAQRKLQNALDGLGLASVQAAREAQARRDELTSRLEQTRAELAGLGADHFDDEFQAAQAECAGAKGTVDRLQALVPGAPLPSDKAAADAQASAAREALREAETADAEARSTRDACAVALDARDDDLARRRQELETQQRQRNDLQAQQRLLLQTHGPDEARAEALAQSQTTRTTAETALRLTREAIEALQPDLLETDRVRLARALEQKTSEHTEAGKRQAIALGALRSDGAEDPQAALAEAQARARAATEVRDTERRRAQAIDRLHQLFLDEQRTLAAQFTQPLADKISGYLRCLFGPDARAGVTLEDSQFTGVRLFRPSTDGAELDFAQLSGGAREQVAAAVRLATAEVLAGNHDGCLPVVFDDAFAYSDPERVIRLQRMLDLAAGRGLQVIVLTCNPSDYAALGARTILLPSPFRVPSPPPAVAATPLPENSEALPQPTAPSASATAPDTPLATALPPGTSAVPVTVTAELRDAFLAALDAAGGSAGNQRLCRALGWDEATYQAVKKDLLATRTILPGRGRGGSVFLRRE